MKKFLSFCLLIVLSVTLSASEGSSSSASSSSAGSSAARSSSSAVDLSKTTATIVTPDGTVELKKPVLLNVDGGAIELNPLQVWVLKSGFINGMLFEVDGEPKESFDFSEKITLKVAKIIANILETTVRVGADEIALYCAIEQNITTKNALSVIYALHYLDSPLGAQIMQFVLDTKKMAFPKDERERYAVLSHGKTVKQAFCVALIPWWKRIKMLDWRRDGVSSVAFSPDGKYVASGSGDNTVRVWDMDSGACNQTLEGHDGVVGSVAFSPDGKYLASGSADYTVRIWDMDSGACNQTLKGHDGLVNSVAFSPDGKHVVSGSNDHTVRIWNVNSGVCKQTLKGHNRVVLSVAFSPDGKHVASGSIDHTMRIWDVSSGTCKQALAGHCDWVDLVAFSPDGKHVASGGGDQTIRIWDVNSGVCKQTLKGHNRMALSMAFSPDGKCLVSGNNDHAMRIWDVSSGTCIKTFEGHGGEVLSVVFSSDGKHVTSGSSDGTVRIWGFADEWRSLSVLEQWHMLVINAKNPFKNRTEIVLCANMLKDLKKVEHKTPTRSACFLARPVLLASARHYKSAFCYISDLMSQHAPADAVRRFFEEHTSEFGERYEKVAANVARYTKEFLRERWGERFDGASSSKDS